MIQVNKYPEERVEVLDPNGVSLGLLNELEFTDLRVQIAQSATEGYSVLHEETEYPISSYGTWEWPREIFDTQMNLIAKLFKAQIEQHDR